MSRSAYVSLVRGINVGGHKKVAMADLRALLADLGLAEPGSLLQSGNLVFRAGRRRTAGLESLLEREAERRLGLRAEFFVRTADEWGSVIAANPFREQAESDPAHLVVMFLKDAAQPAAVQALQAAFSGPEAISANGRELYVSYAAGIGQSRLTSTVIERTLGAHATGRNWNTVLKLGQQVLG